MPAKERNLSNAEKKAIMKKELVFFFFTLLLALSACTNQDKINSNHDNLVFAQEVDAQILDGQYQPERLEELEQFSNPAKLSDLIVNGASVSNYEEMENLSNPEIEAYVREVFGPDADQALQIIALESGFRPGAVGHNKNGSQDYGLMQINSANIGVYQYPLCTEAIKIADNWKQNIDCGKQISDASRRISGHPFYWWSTACLLELPCYTNRK